LGLSKCAGRGAIAKSAPLRRGASADDARVDEFVDDRAFDSKRHTAAQLENDPRLLEACLKIATIMEGIGYSVYARIVPLSAAADLIGGTARIAWQNFRPFVEMERVRAHAKKLGVVPMAGGTTRTPQCDQDEFEDGCTNRLPRLAAVICVSSANRRTSLDGF